MTHLLALASLVNAALEHARARIAAGVSGDLAQNRGVTARASPSTIVIALHGSLHGTATAIVSRRRRRSAQARRARSHRARAADFVRVPIGLRRRVSRRSDR